jgi:hypothetical protein
MKIIVTLFIGLFYLPITTAAIVQVDFAGMNQGPYTIEDFEGVFDSGATYSAASGVRTFSGSGVSRGPGLGLTTNSFPEEIFIDFATPTSSAGYWFGNDDPNAACCDSLGFTFTALMDIFDSNGYLTSIGVEANMNDLNDQFLGFVSDEMITRISIQYLIFDPQEELVGLFHAIDDVMWNEASNTPPVPVPAAVWLFGTALIGFVGMSRRRKVA